jgi:hypothetical protein
LFTRDLKVSRAREHIAAVENLTAEWLGTDAYTIVRRVDPETSHTICTARVKAPPPVAIGLYVGDAVHNLRSALDHAVYLIAEHHRAELPLDVQESLMFPIVGNQNRKGEPTDGAANFESNVKPRLAEWLPENVLNYIESIQPYHWEGSGFRQHWLWVVHDLDRIDKHRRIHLTNAWIDLPYVTSPGDPRTLDIQWRHPDNAPVNDGDVLLTFSGAEEGVDAHFSRAVAISEGAARGHEVGNLLKRLANQIEIYVGSMTGEIVGPVRDDKDLPLQT